MTVGLVRFRASGSVYDVPLEAVVGVRSASDVSENRGHTESDFLIAIGQEEIPVLKQFGDGDHVLALRTATGNVFGLLVEEVLGVRSVSDDAMRSAPAGITQHYISGVVAITGGVELVLSVDALWEARA